MVIIIYIYIICYYRRWYSTKTRLDPFCKMAKIHSHPATKGRSPKAIEGPPYDSPIFTGSQLFHILIYLYSYLMTHTLLGTRSSNRCVIFQTCRKIQTRDPTSQKRTTFEKSWGQVSTCIIVSRSSKNINTISCKHTPTFMSYTFLKGKRCCWHSR